MFETDNVDYVRMLLATGFDIETRDISGNTYLLMATKNNQVETAKLLLENKADVNSVNSEGNTALILSTYNTESCDMTELLLQQNDLHIEHKNNKGYTALMSAIECKNLNAIKLLIDRGVMFHTDWEIPEVSIDNTEETPEKLAVKNHMFNFVKLLQLQKLNDISPIDEVALNKDVHSLTLFTGNNFSKFKKENVSFSNLICRYIISNYRQTKRGQPFKEQADYVILQILCKNLTVDQSREKCLDRAIELATKHGDKMVIEILCQSGVIVSNKALGIAAAKGDVTMLNFLLRFEVKINKFTKHGKSEYYHSALQKSLDNGQYETAKILISYGAILDVKEILYVSVEHKSKKCLDFLSKEYKRETKLAITQLKDILHGCLEKCCQSKTDQTLIWLIQNGARSVNRRDSSGRTPLMMAAENICTKYLKVLINAGANINLRDYDGKTALHNAIYNDIPSNVDFLIRHGANINDRSVIFACCECSHSKKYFKMLLENKNNLNIKDNNGNTVIMRMIQHWTSDSLLKNLKLLLSKNININHKNKFGETALTLSAYRPYPKIMKLLIQRGADINTISKPPYRGSALRILLECLCYDQQKSVQCLNILLDHEIDVQTIYSQSIHILISSGSLSLVPRFISIGLGPSSLRLPNEINSFFQSRSLVSPFGVAILVDNLELTRYLYNISFLTKSDLQIWSDRPNVINQCMMSSPNCVNFLLDISVQPLSLQTLSLIAVSDCLGCEPSRSEKIKLIELPIPLQECLLYKHSSVNLQDSSQTNVSVFETALIQASVFYGDDIYYDF